MLTVNDIRQKFLEYFKKHNDGEIKMMIDKFDMFKEDISTSYLMFKE